MKGQPRTCPWWWFLGWSSFRWLIAFVEAHPLNQYQLAFLEARRAEKQRPTTRRSRWSGKMCVCFFGGGFEHTPRVFLRPVVLADQTFFFRAGDQNDGEMGVKWCEVSDLVTFLRLNNDYRSTWGNGGNFHGFQPPLLAEIPRLRPGPFLRPVILGGKTLEDGLPGWSKWLGSPPFMWFTPIYVIYICGGTTDTCFARTSTNFPSIQICWHGKGAQSRWIPRFLCGFLNEVVVSNSFMFTPI